MSRWQYQYQRIADVMQQRVEQMRPDPHAHHRSAVRGGRCYICTLVDAAPPLTFEQIDRLRALLAPVLPAHMQATTKNRRKVKA